MGRKEPGDGGGGKDVRKKADEDDCGGDYDDRKRLATLVDVATNSPLLQLDDRSLTAIKAIVRRSDANVQSAFDLLYDKIKRNHSQERATLLRKKAIEIVEKWNDMFGQHYKPLRLAHDYLKKILRFEFPNAREVATLAQQQRKERELRTQELLKKKLTSLKAEYPDLRAEIHSTLDQITECLAILAEKKAEDEEQEQFDLDSDGDEFEEYGARSLRSTRDEVEGQEARPHETVENAVLFDSLRDLYRLLTTRHIVNTQEWLSTLMRVDPEGERQARDTLLRDVIDLRNKLLNAREVCEGAGMERIEGASKSGADGEMDAIIWEEGDVLISNSAISEVITAAEVDETIEVTATTTVATETDSSQSSEGKGVWTTEVEATEDTCLKAQLLKQAPVLKWGAFLERWGSDCARPVNNRGLEFENHWGKVDYDVTVPAEKLAESNLNLRAVYYSAEKTEIQPCLAPLRNGGLCQRRDLKRCPFHGPIIPRDSAGKPLVVEERSRQDKSKDIKKKENSDEVAVATDDGLPSVTTVLLKSKDVNVDLVQQAIANVRQNEECRKKLTAEKASVRRERVKRAREHNEACLRAAAIATTSQGFGESLGENVVAAELQRKKPRGGLTALLRKKPTVKDRLARRLLSGRVRDAAVSQLARDEEAAYRESFPNQW